MKRLLELAPAVVATTSQISSPALVLWSCPVSLATVDARAQETGLMDGGQRDGASWWCNRPPAGLVGAGKNGQGRRWTGGAQTRRSSVVEGRMVMSLAGVLPDRLRSRVSCHDTTVGLERSRHAQDGRLLQGQWSSNYYDSCNIFRFFPGRLVALWFTSLSWSP